MLSPGWQGRPQPSHQQTTRAGDHHHFITTLRPGRAVPSCVAPSFHAAPKLRGSSRGQGGSRRVVRGRSPAGSSMGSAEHSWGLNERPSQRARSRLQPAPPASRSSTLVTEPPIWRQLEALVTPRVQQKPRRPVPPPGEDAALRLVVDNELHDIAPTSGHTEGAAMLVETTPHDDAIWGQSPAKKIVPVSMHRIGSAGTSAHSSRPVARVEDLQAKREREQVAVVLLQGNKWTSPRRPRSQHAQRSAPSSQHDSITAHKVQGPASPYNIEQYFRTMWDTDRAAALASAHKHREPELPPSPVAPRAEARQTPVAAVAKSSEERLVVKATATRQEGLAAPVSSEHTEVHRLACAPAFSHTIYIPHVRSGTQLHQQHKQQLLQQMALQQDQQQNQSTSSSILQVSSTSIGGSMSEQLVDGPAGFVPSSWREVMQSESIASGLLETPVRHDKVKARSGAFGRYEMQKAAQGAAVHLQHEVHSSNSDGLQTHGPPAAVVASAQLDAGGRQTALTPSTLHVLEDEQTQWSLGKGPGPSQTTAVAPDYSWRPIDSLAWIPGLVPARGPLLSPWPQPDPPPSPLGNTGPLVTSATHISRPRTANTMEWTREGVEMNLAGPVIQVRGHHVEVAEAHRSPGISSTNLQTQPQTAQVEGQQHETQPPQAAQPIEQAELIAPVQAASSPEEALVGTRAADGPDEANVESK